MVLGRLKEINGVFKKTVRLHNTRCPNADKKKGGKLEAGTPGGI